MRRSNAPADPGQALPLLARTLVGSSAMIVAVGAALQWQLKPQGPEALSWGAIALALLLPVVATLVRGEGLVAAQRREDAETQRARFGRRLVFFAINEGACVICAVAMMIAPSLLPAAAALFPLAVMAMNLPSTSR